MSTSPAPRLTTMHASTLGRLEQRLVGGDLERDLATATDALVGGDEQLGAAVLDATLERCRGEPAEDDRVDGADARAREHRDRQLGNHRQVDRDAVPSADALLAQDVGELADLVVQVLVGVGTRAAVVALPDESGLVATPRVEMPIEAVGADVELAAVEPRVVELLETAGTHLVERLDPVEVLLGHLAPEALGVVERAGVHLAVLLHAGDAGVLDVGGASTSDLVGSQMLESLVAVLVGHDVLLRPSRESVHWVVFPIEADFPILATSFRRRPTRAHTDGPNDRSVRRSSDDFRRP